MRVERRDTIIESVTQWTGEEGDNRSDIQSPFSGNWDSIKQWTGEEGDSRSVIQPPGSDAWVSVKEKHRIPLSGIALATSLAITSIALPSTTDRFSSIFQCEEDCASSSTEDDINEQLKFKLQRELETILRNAKSEVIESTHESNFARDLHALLLKYGRPAVEVLGDFIYDPNIDVEIASEALLVVGRSKDTRSEVSRFRLLIQALDNPSPIIRDGAAVALAELDEPGAIPYLRNAVQREEYASLKKDYLQIIEELEAA